LLSESGLYADFNVVEVDENGDVQTVLMGQTTSLLRSRLATGLDRGNILLCHGLQVVRRFWAANDQGRATTGARRVLAHQARAERCG
jgi:hypothetical protein